MIGYFVQFDYCGDFVNVQYYVYYFYYVGVFIVEYDCVDQYCEKWCCCIQD